MVRMKEQAAKMSHRSYIKSIVFHIRASLEGHQCFPSTVSRSCRFLQPWSSLPAATQDVCFIMTRPQTLAIVPPSLELSFCLVPSLSLSLSLTLCPQCLALFLCLAYSLCVSQPLFDTSSPSCKLYWSGQVSCRAAPNKC